MLPRKITDLPIAVILTFSVVCFVEFNVGSQKRRLGPLVSIGLKGVIQRSLLIPCECSNKVWIELGYNVLFSIVSTVNANWHKPNVIHHFQVSFHRKRPTLFSLHLFNSYNIRYSRNISFLKLTWYVVFFAILHEAKYFI